MLDHQSLSDKVLLLLLLLLMLLLEELWVIGNYRRV
jgi:hypothetical protein